MNQSAISMRKQVQKMESYFFILFTLCFCPVFLRGEPISDTVSKVWEQLTRNGTLRRHRSFMKVGFSNKDCATNLFLTQSRVPSFTKNESRTEVVKTCGRASLWPKDAMSSTSAKSSNKGDIDLMFVIACYISNTDNAHLLNLTIGGIFSLHPQSDIHIVDSYSPEPDLIKKVVEYYQSNSYQIGDITISKGNEGKLPGKEIGALRNAITFIETERKKPPPQFVAFLMHSTGLRIGLPLVEMQTLYQDNVCKMFPLDVPWFRYEKGNHLESQYGVSSALVVNDIC